MFFHVFAGGANIAVTSTEKDKPLIHNELAVLFCAFASTRE